MQPIGTRSHCGYCGLALAGASSSERFGERFCSEAHAEQFVAGVRAARMHEATLEETTLRTACALPPAGQRSWSDYAKRGLCWGAPLLALLASALIWPGSWAAGAGSLLSVVALLACPLGMYFMMRGMMGMPHQDRRAEAEPEKGNSHA